MGRRSGCHGSWRLYVLECGYSRSPRHGLANRIGESRVMCVRLMFACVYSYARLCPRIMIIPLYSRKKTFCKFTRSTNDMLLLLLRSGNRDGKDRTTLGRRYNHEIRTSSGKTFHPIFICFLPKVVGFCVTDDRWRAICSLGERRVAALRGFSKRLLSEVNEKQTHFVDRLSPPVAFLAAEGRDALHSLERLWLR